LTAGFADVRRNKRSAIANIKSLSSLRVVVTAKRDNIPSVITVLLDVGADLGQVITIILRAEARSLLGKYFPMIKPTPARAIVFACSINIFNFHIPSCASSRSLKPQRIFMIFKLMAPRFKRQTVGA
jgi:predicted lysophospholipase L1 biosynthesis ABC-type transport system permease subunit